MENALWNGKLYTAAEIAESYELEKSVRKASGRKELRCPDADCPSPVLRYCHGEIKSAFFAHLDNCTCDYAEFDKENTQLMRKVKRTISSIWGICIRIFTSNRPERRRDDGRLYQQFTVAIT